MASCLRLTKLRERGEEVAGLGCVKCKCPALFIDYAVFNQSPIASSRDVDVDCLDVNFPCRHYRLLYGRHHSPSTFSDINITIYQAQGQLNTSLYYQSTPKP